MSAVADKLREARALIERGWTQGIMARDARDVPTGCIADDAARWCPVGAMFRACAPYSNGDYETYDAAYMAVFKVIGGPVHRWNDAPERTQADVLAAFDRAIDLAERGEVRMNRLCIAGAWAIVAIMVCVLMVCGGDEQ